MIEAVGTERKIIRRRRDAPGAARLVVPPLVAFGNRFGKYKLEEEKEVRKFDPREDEVLKQLKDAWKAYMVKKYISKAILRGLA